MANRAQRRRSMKTQELREQAIEAMDQTPYLDLEDTDPPVRVWHPLLVDDDAQTRIDRVQANEDLKKDEDDKPVYPPRNPDGTLAESFVIRLAKSILGDEEHARFIKAGGRSHDVELAWNEMTRQYEEELEDPKAD